MKVHSLQKTLAKKALKGRLIWVGRSHLTQWLQKGFEGIIVESRVNENNHLTFEVEVTLNFSGNGWHCPDKVSLFTKAQAPYKSHFKPGETIELNEPFNHIKIILI